MSEAFPYIDIILLAMIAAFVALRLRSVLGRRTGNERRPSEEAQQRYSDTPREGPNGGDTPVDVADVEGMPAPDYRMILSPSSTAFDGIEAIRDKDPAFDVDQFAAGARGAYELILTSFWSGNLDELRPFVSDAVFEDFKAAADALEKEGQTLDNSLERVRKIEFVDAGLEDGKTAEITLKFTSDVRLMTKDSEGRIIAGDPVDDAEAIDRWTFERDLTSADPNWTLIATESD